MDIFLVLENHPVLNVGCGENNFKTILFHDWPMCDGFLFFNFRVLEDHTPCPANKNFNFSIYFCI